MVKYGLKTTLNPIMTRARMSKVNSFQWQDICYLTGDLG